jgi:hypothetical protein
MKTLIAPATVVIAATRSFRFNPRPDFFPSHGNFLHQQDVSLGGGFHGIEIIWGLKGGISRTYIYGIYDLNTSDNYRDCLFGSTIINGLRGGEFYNFVVRHQLIYVDGIPV